MMLKAKRLHYSYGRIRGLIDADLEIKEDTITGVFGSNGAGKSTLVNLLAGVFIPNEGKILFQGKDVTNLPAYERIKRGIALVPERRGLFTNLTVLENLKIGAYSSDTKENFRDFLVEEIYEIFPRLMERKNQTASKLSGGERVMLTTARGLMSDPTLLLLDEPMLGLQPSLILKVLEMIRKISEKGVTILIVEQNFYQLIDLIDLGILLENGKIVLEGPKEDIRENPRIKEAYLGI